MGPPCDPPASVGHGRIAGGCLGFNRAQASRRLAHGRTGKLAMKDKAMFEIHREEIDWAGRKLVLETGRIARQADGAVLASYGETTVLATVVSAKSPKPGRTSFP